MGKTWQDYESDQMLRDAVERQFLILGEAFHRLRAHDDDTAAQIADLPNIIGFRNVVVHGYDSIDDRLVWNNATTLLQPLIETLENLLGQVTSGAPSPGNGGHSGDLR